MAINGQGHTVDFRNAVVIMTSNLGSEFLATRGAALGFAAGGADASASDDELQARVKGRLRETMRPVRPKQCRSCKGTGLRLADDPERAAALGDGGGLRYRRRAPGLVRVRGGRVRDVRHAPQRERGHPRRLAAIRPLLPAPLRAAVQAGPIDEGQWCLLVSSNAVAAKLRQFVPALQLHLESQGLAVSGIRIKVQGHSR